MLGASKSFFIFLLLSSIIAYGTKNIMNGIVIMGCYAVVMIIYRFITR